MVDRLYQQTPVTFRQPLESGVVERPVRDLPGAVGAILFDQPRFDARFAGKAC